MQKFQIQIELLSDLCVSDGGIYNSSIDTDVCYDEDGFPYIPAKRLKGCLREAALELMEWGEEIRPEELFGDKGSQSGKARVGKVRIGNAYLRKAEEYRKQLEENRGHLLLHPQNILQHFTYLRTQTSIDPETGAAEENTLRTMRVVNRGLIFAAEVSMEEDAALAEQKNHALEHCCRALRHMGIARTRGLGEVRVTLKQETAAPDSEDTACRREGISSAWQPESDCLEYEITLHEPLICKSVNGQEENTMDYIEGGKILGLLVKYFRAAGEDAVQVLLAEPKLRCANAYLSDGTQRLVEVPASYYSVKNEKSVYADHIYGQQDFQETEGKGRQLKPMKHCYVPEKQNGKQEEKLRCSTVEIEERYHHRRPADKGIGRAAEEASASGDSTFYQIASIMAGQKFRGFISAPAPLLEQICRQMEANPEITLGYGRASEYGAASWRVVKCEKEKEAEIQRTDEFYVKLEAPVILYSDAAAYTVDWNVLAEEIAVYLGLREEGKPDPAENIQKYMKYTTVGGFQVTWGMRKPTVEAFDKGTVLHYRCSRPVEIPVGKRLWLGERLSEGYGEATVTAVDRRGNTEFFRERFTEEAKTEKMVALDAAGSGFLWELCESQFREYVFFRAGRSAWELVQKQNWKKNEAAKPTVSNLLLMCAEAESLAAVTAAAEERFSKKAEGKAGKLEVWRKIRQKVLEQAGTLPEAFQAEYRITHYEMEREKLEFLYLKEFVKQLKYALRPEKEGEDRDKQN